MESIFKIDINKEEINAAIAKAVAESAFGEHGMKFAAWELWWYGGCLLFGLALFAFLWRSDRALKRRLRPLSREGSEP
jgi:hypothetical protein